MRTLLRASCVCLVGLLLCDACRATPPAPVDPDQAARDEIIAFAIQLALHEQPVYRVEGGTPWNDGSKPSTLIVYGPSGAYPMSGYVSLDQAIAVWYYDRITLIKAADAKRAIAAHKAGWSQQAEIVTLSIVKMAPDRRTAEICVGIDCGPLCGDGTFYEIRKGLSGKWEVTNSRSAWVS